MLIELDPLDEIEEPSRSLSLNPTRALLSRSGSDHFYSFPSGLDVEAGLVNPLLGMLGDALCSVPHVYVHAACFCIQYPERNAVCIPISGLLISQALIENHGHVYWKQRVFSELQVTYFGGHGQAQT